MIQQILCIILNLNLKYKEIFKMVTVTFSLKDYNAGQEFVRFKYNSNYFLFNMNSLFLSL